ncbi:hypothetical protein BH11BAC5_BH11BAC5_48610 [soil metagenome]
MEKIQIGKNRTEGIGHFDMFHKLCYDIILYFRQCNFGDFRAQDFDELFFNTEFFLQARILKDIPMEVNGLKLSRDKFWNLVEKPGEYFQIIKLVNDLKGKIDSRQKNLNLSEKKTYKEYLKHFLVFSDENILEINQSLIDDAEELSKIYIHTENGKVVYDFTKKLVDLFNDTGVLSVTGASHFTFNNEAFGKFIKNLIHFEESTAFLKVNGVLGYDKN